VADRAAAGRRPVVRASRGPRRLLYAQIDERRGASRYRLPRLEPHAGTAPDGVPSRGSLPNGRRVPSPAASSCGSVPGPRFAFLSLEDETGIANIIVAPNRFDTYRRVLVEQAVLLIEGIMQNQENVISVKADRVEALGLAREAPPFHDFH
jgi:hypothetical protein